MNLLVTNTRNGQAYCAIRSLRRHAKKIIGTVYGTPRFIAKLAPSALSRFVDRVYWVPSLVEDWRRGSFAYEPTEAADNFVREILRICERENIDVVLPSWDPQICVLSQSKRQFTERGVTLPVPEWPVLAKLVDKYRLIQEADAAGFPCPKTFLPKDRGEALEVAHRLGFPLVVKPRFSSGSRGVCLVRNQRELTTSIKKLMPIYGTPLIQEFIGGETSGLINLILVLDHEYRLCAYHSRRVIRSVSDRFTSVTSAEVCMHDPLLAERASGLLRKLGYYGHAAFQLQLDPKDGVAKLLEINCRLSYRAWCEIEVGLDLPLLMLQVEKREKVPSSKGCELEARFVYPVEESIARLIHPMRVLNNMLAQRRARKTLSVRCSDASAYRRINSTFCIDFTDWYFKSLWVDPFHAIAWYGTRLRSLIEELRQPAV